MDAKVDNAWLVELGAVFKPSNRKRLELIMARGKWVAVCVKKARQLLEDGVELGFAVVEKAKAVFQRWCTVRRVVLKAYVEGRTRL